MALVLGLCYLTKSKHFGAAGHKCRPQKQPENRVQTKDNTSTTQHYLLFQFIFYDHTWNLYDEDPTSCIGATKEYTVFVAPNELLGVRKFSNTGLTWQPCANLTIDIL